MVRDFNEQAQDLIFRHRFAEARTLLERAISGMPADWKPYHQDGDVISIAAWNEDDFLARGGHQELPLTGPRVIWIPGSYSKAWCQLAEVASSEGRWDEALSCIDKGLELEPDHPELWCKKGDLLDEIEQHEQSLECYERASKRERMFVWQATQALYGQAMQLVSLGRLEEAESVLWDLLELDPDDEDARDCVFDLTGISIAKMLQGDLKTPPPSCQHSEAQVGEEE